MKGEAMMDIWATEEAAVREAILLAEGDPDPDICTRCGHPLEDHADGSEAHLGPEYMVAGECGFGCGCIREKSHEGSMLTNL